MRIEEILSDIHSRKTYDHIVPDQSPDIMEDIRLRSFDPAKVIFMHAALEYSQQKQKPPIYKESDIEQLLARLRFSCLLEDEYNSRKQYLVSAIVPEYIIGRKDNYYHFPQATIGTNVEIGPRGWIFMNEARVLTLPYYHPFVGSDGNICTRGYNWTSQMGITFGKTYSLDNLKKLGTMLGLVLSKARNWLETSYIGDNGVSSHLIDKSRKVGSTRWQAENYATIKGIPKSRIFNND